MKNQILSLFVTILVISACAPSPGEVLAWKVSSSTGICGMRKNEAKLTKNDQAFSQYASTKL